MRKILFENIALEQFNEWEQNNKNIFAKILELLNDTKINPFKGLGKPEPLKNNLS